MNFEYSDLSMFMMYFYNIEAYRMASARQEGMLQAVHVPCCLNDECKEHMDCLVALLEERGVKCIYQARGDYGLGGLFSDHFINFFKRCRRTIIHICPQSLQMVKPVKDVFMSDSEKTSFFRIPCSPSSFQDDLDVHMFNIWNLSDEAVRKTFVREMAYEMSSKMLTQEIPLSFEEVYTIRETVFTPINIIHRGAEHPVVCLHKLLFLSSDTEEKIRRSVLECTNQEQWSTFLNQTSPQDLFFILNKVLPELYRRRQIIHLAHLAGTHIPALRDRTLRFVQLLLLSNDPTPWSRTDLKETEIAMFNTLLLQKDTMTVNTIVTYLMTLVCYIMACKEANKEKECDDHFGVITSRPLFQAAELKKNKRKSVRGTADLWINVLHLCVSHWREQKSKKRDITFKQQPKQQWIMELLGFISRIIQLNRNCPFDFRIFPSSQINIQGRGKDSTRGLITILVANVTICGMTALLEHKTTDLVCSSNFNEVCQEAVSRLIEALSSLCVEDKSLMFQQLTTLLFHHNRHIRMQAPHLFILDNTYGSMTTILWERLVLTTQDLLYPLLQDNRNTKNSHEDEDEDKDEVRGGWTVVKHKLGSDGVLTHVLRPSTYEHRNEVRCSLKDKRFHELRLLKEFQHSHLVELRAFCDMCWPQFYITEDYSTNALQSMLVNKSRNDNCFSLKKLLIFVIDALKGVQFLHENNIVHRDLTAANVFITASGQVKLSGLMQARRPSGDTIRDFECSFIPTRWTAPESLRQCQFSKMSDMWMVGHLIYEMLTHGRLPYADVEPVDTELIPMVVAGRRRLCDEACIPDRVHSVIIQLTNIEPSSRLSEVKAVIDVLAAFVDEMNEDMNSVKFPDIRGEGQAATEHRKGPVISVLDTYFGGFNETLDETSDERKDYINISNRHQRPVRGPMSIKELCPKDFSSDVWSVLTEGHLPGISPLISQPKMNSERQLEISFAIPAKYSICSLARAVVRRWLGNDIQEYVECLGNIATAIAELHSRGLVLCDFCADTILIEKVPTPTGQINKVVWFASIANIRSMQHHVNASGQLIEVPPPQNSEALRRAAPEVVKHGLYSQASDVFCFGRLMWWVFNTFCRVEVGEEVNKHALDPFAEVDDSELYSRISDLGAAALVQRPPACPPVLYHLMLKCWEPRRSERPSIQDLQELLTGVEDSSRIGNHNQTSEYDYFEGYSEAETDDVYNNPDTINSEIGCNVECHNQRAEDDNAEGYSDIPDYHLSCLLPESESSWNNDSDEPYESFGSEPVVASGIQRSLPPSTRPHYQLPPPPSQSVTQDRESHADRVETGSGYNTRSTKNQSPLEHDAQSATGLKKGQTKRKIAGSDLASNLSLAEGPLSFPFGKRNSFSVQQQQPASTTKQYPTSVPEQKLSLKAKQPPSTLEPKLPHEQSRSTHLAEQTAVSSPASPPSPLLPHHRHVAQVSSQHRQPQSVSPPPLPPRRYADYEHSDPVTSPPSAEAGISSSSNAPPLPPRRPSSSSKLEHSSPPPRPPRGSGLVVTSISVSSLSPTPSNSLLTTHSDPLSPTPSLLPSNPPPLPPRHSLRKPPSAPDKPQESNSPPATSGLSLPMSSLPIVPPQSLLRLEDQPSSALLPQSPISISLTASSSPAATSRPMPQQTIASSSSGHTSLSRPHPKHELLSCKAHREDCESSLVGGESTHLAGEAKYTSTFTIQLEVKNLNLANKKEEHTLKVLPSTLLTAKERTDAPTHNAFHTTEDTDNKATDDPVDKSIPVSEAIKAIDARTKATEAMDDAVYTNTQAVEAMDDPVYTNTQAVEAMDDPVYTNTQDVEAMDDPVYTNTQAVEAIDPVYRNTPGNEITDDPYDDTL